MISLRDVDVGKRCRIVKLVGDDFILRRFLDIGIVPGACIEKGYSSILGGIRAYFVMGTTIAIRDDDIEGVIVEYE